MSWLFVVYFRVHRVCKYVLYKRNLDVLGSGVLFCRLTRACTVILLLNMIAFKGIFFCFFVFFQYSYVFLVIVSVIFLVQGFLLLG